MSITIGMLISGQHATATGPDDGARTVAAPGPFTRDQIVYDGQGPVDSAMIPLSGTTDAADGAVIEARLVDATTGAQVQGWKAVAVAAGGSWLGSYGDAQRATVWLRAEARVQGSTAPAGQTANRFGVGHVIALWGQSEIQNLTQPFYNGPNPPAAVTAENDAQFWWHDRLVEASGAAGVQSAFVTAGTTNTRFVAIANSLAAARPGEKFTIVLQTASGTGPNQLVDDGFPGRAWADDLAVHTAATGGQSVGIAAFSWYASPRGLRQGYGAYMHEIVFSKAVDGTPRSTPFTLLTGTPSETAVDHTLADIYDFTRTKVTFLEPHRFDPPNDGFIADCRDGVRDMYAASTEPALVGPGHPVLSYINGYPGGQYNWNDGSHPGQGEGSIRFGIAMVQSAIRELGLTSWDRPVIDAAFWDPAGAYVELYSSAGPIVAGDGIRTTGILGVQVNAARAPASIVAGRLRVNAADVGDGSPFTVSTTVDFIPGAAPDIRLTQAEIDALTRTVAPDNTSITYSHPTFELAKFGGGTLQVDGVDATIDMSTGDIVFTKTGGGAFTNPATQQPLTAAFNLVYRDLAEDQANRLPHVDVGAPGMPDGVPIATKPDPAVIASTIVGAQPFAVAGTTYIEDTTTHGATTTEYTILVRANFANVGGYLARDDNNQFIVWPLANGFIRHQIPASGLLATPAGAMPYDQMADYIIRLQPATGSFNMRVNGTEVFNLTGTPWMWQSFRKLRVLGFQATNGMTGDVERVAVWKGAGAFTADIAVDAPTKDITGPLSNAIALTKAAPAWRYVVGEVTQ